MLTVALATVPTMLTVLIGILLNNARLSDVNSRLGEFRSHMDARLNDVDRRFDGVDSRFEEMKEMWRTELHRVEEVIDARLRHLEER
jgi:chaperonin cofactor prefoldin